MTFLLRSRAVPAFILKEAAGLVKEERTPGIHGTLRNPPENVILI
jgi:hypothetical protein